MKRVGCQARDLDGTNSIEVNSASAFIFDSGDFLFA
jgi:hypothetical protein